MTSQLSRLAVLVGVIGAVWQPLSAHRQAPRSGTPDQRIQVCTLVPKEEVKKHLPWEAMFDQMPLEEEPIGADGSSCGFPSVHVQVLPFSRGFLDAARKSAPLEAIAGVGDEAYFRNNRNLFAELFVRVGARLLTLQADADGAGEMQSVTPRLVDLAKVYVAKLR